jgi:hypothetical protein
MTNVMILTIFTPKKCGLKLATVTQITAICVENNDHSYFSKKKTLFFAENWPKSLKIVITLTPESIGKLYQL